MDSTKRPVEYSGHIHENADGERLFALHPENDEAFTRSGRQVIDGCRLNISLEVWFEECNTMLGRVHEWTRQRHGSILACYAVPRGSGIGLFFVPCSKTFDFDLADQLAGLAMDLTRDFYNLGMVEAHQIPASEVDHFVVLEHAAKVYPNANSPHHPVEA
jgi:hypothetical protein